MDPEEPGPLLRRDAPSNRPEKGFAELGVSSSRENVSVDSFASKLGVRGMAAILDADGVVAAATVAPSDLALFLEDIVAR